MTEARSPQPFTWRLLAAALLVSVCYAAAILFTSTDFRGTDQYWYIEDTLTLMGGGPAETHETYPFSLVGPNQKFSQHRPLIHNGPALRVWALVARPINDPHLGIILTHVFGNILAALLVFGAVRQFAQPVFAFLASIVLLLEPATFWVSLQALSEPFSAVFVAAALFLVVRFPTHVAAYLGAVLCIVVAALGRMWLLPFLLVLPIGLAVMDRHAVKKERVAKAVAVIVVGFAVYLPLARVFQSYGPGLNMMSLLQVRAVWNMVNFFAISPPPTFELAAFTRGMAAGFVSSLETQFFFSGRSASIGSLLHSAAWMPANVMFLASFTGLFLKGGSRLSRLLMGFSVTAMAVHLGMSAVFQNQFRYLVCFMPFFVVGASAALSSGWPSLAGSRRRHLAVGVAFAAVVASFMAANYRNAMEYRRDLRAELSLRGDAAALVESIIPADARVALDTRFGSRWPMDHALYPRQVLSLATENPYTPEVYLGMLEAFGATHLIADETSSLADLLSVRLVSSSGKHHIYELGMHR